MGKSKYPRWILKERKLKPLGNVCLCDMNGNVVRTILNTYECPHCHNTYECCFTNKMDVRKCRWCNKPVSPYDGDITDQILLPKGMNELPDDLSKYKTSIRSLESHDRY